MGSLGYFVSVNCMQKYDMVSLSASTKCGSLLLAFVLAVGCTNTNGTMNKEGTGALMGAGLGALAGSAFGGGKGHIAGALVGASIGAVAGDLMGKALDAQDRYYQQQAYTSALENNRSGVASTWHNPDSMASGRITPRSTYRMKDGTYCREFTQQVKIGSKMEEAVGRACRNEDGSWTIVS